MISYDFPQSMINIMEVFLLVENMMSHSFSLPRTPGGRYKEPGYLSPGLRSSSEGPSVAQARFYAENWAPECQSHHEWEDPLKDSTIWQCFYYCFNQMPNVCFFLFVESWGKAKRDEHDESSGSKAVVFNWGLFGPAPSPTPTPPHPVDVW